MTKAKAKIQIPNGKTGDFYFSIILFQMDELGSPTIRAYWNSEKEIWQAIEGSHRVLAAIELGLQVNIEQVYLSDEIGEDFYVLLGIDDHDQVITVRDILEAFYPEWDESREQFIEEIEEGEIL